MNNLKTIGAFLKDARESKNLTEEEVSSKTKINLKLLQHLENDRLLKLPNKTYVVGFVKSCAKTLNLNEDEAIMSLNYTYEQIIEPTIIKEDPEQTNEDTPNELEESAVAVIKSFYNKKVVIILIAIVVLALLLKAAIAFFGNIAKEKVSFEKDEITNIAEPKEVPKVEVFESVQTKTIEPTKEEPKAPLKSVESTTPIKEPVKEEVKKEVNLNGKFPFIKFYPMPRKLFTILTEAKENQDRSILPQRIISKFDSELQNIYIKAVDGDTWISFKIDNNKIKRYVLKQGKGAFLQGREIQLFMGNINVTKIFFNNELISAPSKTGVKSLVFPQTLSESLVLPLFPNYKYKSYTSKEYIENMATE